MSQYLIWSNQKGMWWGPDGRGYTRLIEEAGRYPEAEARRIVADATIDGQLRRDAEGFLGGLVSVLDEVAVPAPEDRPARVEDAQPGEADAATSAAGAPVAAGAPAQDPDAPDYASPFAYRAERRWTP